MMIAVAIYFYRVMHVYAYVEMRLRTERSPTTLGWISASAEETGLSGLV